ncbi:MAG: hypothetical protein ABWY48_10305, partial [Pseudoxanthomonas sp.]
ELRQRLHSLPDIPLPETLWQRVEEGRKRKMGRRKLRGGMAALMLVAVAAVPMLVTTGDEALQVERQMAQQPVDKDHDVQSQLRALDLALQAAYDRGASDAEIAPMWVARNALLAGAAFRHDRI